MERRKSNHRLKMNLSLKSSNQIQQKSGKKAEFWLKWRKYLERIKQKSFSSLSKPTFRWDRRRLSKNGLKASLTGTKNDFVWWLFDKIIKIISILIANFINLTFSRQESDRDYSLQEFLILQTHKPFHLFMVDPTINRILKECQPWEPPRCFRQLLYLYRPCSYYR